MAEIERDKTTNLQLIKPKEEEFYSIQDFNGNSDLIDNWAEEVDSHLNDLTYETAGGMGTAITLNMQPLKQGYNKTFIASANNNGAATTINGKKLYKPNTTTAPNIISGKAYTVWYNSVSDCFFLQASAEGNATKAQVLAGAIFSTDDDTGLVGAMPNNGALNKVLALNESFNLPAGYYSGGKVTQSIPNNGAINASLNCGQSKTLPAGYVSGGTITANSLASQTPSNADASKILSGYYAWMNGAQVWGNGNAKEIKILHLGSIGWWIDKAQSTTYTTDFTPFAICCRFRLNTTTTYLDAFGIDASKFGVGLSPSGNLNISFNGNQIILVNNNTKPAVEFTNVIILGY